MELIKHLWKLAGDRGEITGGGDTPTDTRGGGGAVIPPRVHPYNFVGQILKIFERLGVKSNSCRKYFDKFRKILLENLTN